jgi:hypothetical protein
MCLNETYNMVFIGKYQSDNFAIRNGLEHLDDLPQLLFNFASEYAIRRAEEKRERLKLKETHQVLAHSDDINTVEKTEEKHRIFVRS